MPHPLMCLVEIPYSTATPQHTLTPASRSFYNSAPHTQVPTAHTVGICLLDVSSGVCRAGCFTTADDPARSALAVALLTSDPSEAVAVRNSLSGATVTLLKQHFETKTAAGPGFSSSGGEDSVPGGRGVGGHVPGVSWLSPSAAGNLLVSPTAAALEGSLSDEQLQQLQQIAVTAAASISAQSSGSVASSRVADAAMTAVLAAVGVAVKQLQRCSLLSDVLPTLEVQPLEALTARGGMQPG